MSEIINPFELQPVSLQFQFYAFPMSIIQANAKTDITPWLCKKFFNCYFYERDNNYDFRINLGDYWTDIEGVVIKEERIYKQTELENGKAEEVLKDCVEEIKSGKYPYGRWNVGCVSQLNGGYTEYRRHDFILIGVDEEKEEFISAAIDSRHGKMRIFNLTYDEFRAAISTIRNQEEIWFNILKFNENFDFSLFEFDNIKKQFEEYLAAVYSNQRKDIEYNEIYSYGINGPKRLKLHFLEAIKKSKNIDIRFSRGLAELKNIMLTRIKYMAEHNYISDKYIENAQHVAESAQVIHLLCLKYNMDRKESTAGRIEKLFNELILDEITYLPEVVEEMQNVI